MKNILDPLKQFNKPDSILAITTYPNPRDGILGKKEFSAVGWHSEKTLTHLQKHAPVIVLAEKREGPTVRKITDDMVIARVWKKGSPFSLFKILKVALSLSKVRHVYAQFEFNVFGGILPNLLLLLILAVLRLTGRSITFELHQVITDIALLQKHINITNPLLQRFFNLGLNLFYRILGVVANDIIVFEEELKNRLSSFVPTKKIQVLSLAVDSKKHPSMKRARSLLSLPQDEFIILVFGFINGYKGIDWIINALKDHSDKKIRLLIAGGENPYLKDQPHYQKFYQGIITEAKKYPHVTLSGFVPDDQIQNYFAAASVVVMPYEVFMAASGPFSLALSYGKPLLLSSVLSDYAQSKDFKQSLNEAGILNDDIFFKLNTKDLVSHIERAQTSSAYLEQLTMFTNSLAGLRGSEVVTKNLFQIITTPHLFKPVLLEETSLSIN